MQNSRKIHTFDNGVRVYDDHLNPPQRVRYARCNVHEEDEEPLFLEVLSGLPKEATYAALGSAIGYYLILAIQRRPDLSVHAFEPLAMHRRYLEENLALNGIAPGRVQVHPEAVAKEAGELWLVEDSYSSALDTRRGALAAAKRWLRRTARSVGLSGGPSRTQVRVQTLSLDQMVARAGGRLDLVQMDVQGAEGEALLGAERALASGQVGVFLISTHGAELHRDVRQTLARAGYTIEYDDPNPGVQPDGMLLASRGRPALSAPRAAAKGGIEEKQGKTLSPQGSQG